MRWLYVLVIGSVVTLFGFLLLTGQYISDGPVLISLTSDHGLHVGDVFVVATWAVAMAALVLLATTSARGRTP